MLPLGQKLIILKLKASEWKNVAPPPVPGEIDDEEYDARERRKDGFQIPKDIDEQFQERWFLLNRRQAKLEFQ